MKAHRLALVEAAWRMDLDGPQWLHLLAETMAGLLPASTVSCVVSLSTADDRIVVSRIAGTVGDAELERMARTNELIPAEGVRWMREVSAEDAAVFYNSEVPQAIQYEELRVHIDALGGTDTFCLLAQDAPSQMFSLFSVAPRANALSPAERRAWVQVGTHVAAAARVRRALEAMGGAGVGAVLAADGRVLAANDGVAMTVATQELFRHAVQAAERARVEKSRGNPEEAMELQQALWAGRWSVVHCWDRDGRRFYAAVENAPAGRSLRTLSARQATILRLAMEDRTLKEIAGMLALKQSTVSHHLAEGLRRVGFASRSDLILAMAGTTTLAELALPVDSLAGARVAYWQVPALAAAASALLTPAERIVAPLLAQGKSDAQIAETLALSPHTVSNHAASIFRTLGVGSRYQLAALLATHVER